MCCGVLSGNRNFEGRIHPNTRANYLASPLLVVAYAIAGTVCIDFEKEPIGETYFNYNIVINESFLLQHVLCSIIYLLLYCILFSTYIVLLYWSRKLHCA